MIRPHAHIVLDHLAEELLQSPMHSLYSAISLGSVGCGQVVSDTHSLKELSGDAVCEDGSSV